jgi:hypothetical protein
VFGENEPFDRFIVCVNNERNFSHIKLQEGLFTLSPYFGTDHAKAIAKLFEGDTRLYKRYLINSKLIENLNEHLCHDKHICKSSVFPDDDVPFQNYVKEKTKEIKMKFQGHLLP